MQTPVRRDPDARGYFGPFGGKYVPETLVEPIEELQRAYYAVREDVTFRSELQHLLTHYVGRPTPLYEATRLGAASGGARIFLKREDLTHTGSHKINNVLAFPGIFRGALDVRATGINEAMKLAAAKAEGQNLMATLGQKLLPVLTKIMDETMKVVHWLEKHKGAAQALGAVIGGVLVVAIAAYAASMASAAAATIAATWPILLIVAAMAMGAAQGLVVKERPALGCEPLVDLGAGWEGGRLGAPGKGEEVIGALELSLQLGGVVGVMVSLIQRKRDGRVSLSVLSPIRPLLVFHVPPGRGLNGRELKARGEDGLLGERGGVGRDQRDAVFGR